MNKLMYAVAVTAVFSLTSCLEDKFAELSNSQKTATLENIQVSSDFQWATSKTVSVQVLGLPTQAPIKSTLKISADSAVYYTGFHAISDTLNLQVEVPAAVQELTLRMGTIQRTVVIEGGKAVFTYVASVN